MDLMYLLDRLEEVLTTGSRVPFMARILVDEQEVKEILDQIRVTVPDEIKVARTTTQHRDEILREAQVQAERLLREANDTLAERVSDHEFVAYAQDRAAEIQDQALREAADIRRDADQYAIQALERLRSQVNTIAHSIERGINELSNEGGYSNGVAAHR